jgi:hypothetical protein
MAGDGQTDTEGSTWQNETRKLLLADVRMIENKPNLSEYSL